MSQIDWVTESHDLLWPTHCDLWHLKQSVTILCLFVYSAIDQAVLLNEMGRMFVHFNERRLAYKYYFKSNDIVIPAEDMPRFGRYEDEIKPLLVSYSVHDQY